MATSDISALLEQAKCFRCLSHKELVAVQTYIIAYASNQGMDPNTLLNEARCLLCLSQKRLFQIRAYLIANIGGLSTDPQELADLAQCYRCIPDGYMEAVRAYLLSQDPNGPGTSDPDVLEANAATFTGLTPEQSLAIQVYLLANNAGLSTDPGELQDLAKCFDCLSFEVLNSVTTQVVDEVENDGGISGGVCVDDPAQQIPVITGIYTDGILTGLSILLPQVCCDPLSVTIYEADDAIGTGAVAIATGLIDDSHAGEINYTLPDYTFGSTPAKDYVLVTQNCQDGTESDYSNAVEVDSTCGTATSVIEVTGAGDADANGLYEWNQTEYDTSGRFVYDNNVSNWFIEFVDGTGGVEAWMYNDAVAIMYRLPLGECFPCGEWVVGPGDLGTAPAPTCEWATEGAEIATEWAGRVVDNGGVRPSFNTVYATMTFWDSLTTAIKGKLKAVNLFAPDNNTAALTPLIKSWGGATWNKVNNVAVGFGTAEAGLWGITPDGQTGIWTSFNPSSHADCTINDFGWTVYTNHPDYVSAGFGGRGGAPGGYIAMYPNFAGAWYFDWPDSGGASRISATIPARFRGFVSYNRSAANRADVWYANANSPFASGGSSVGAVAAGKPDCVVYLGAWNDIGTWQAGGCRGFAFSAFHLALNATEAEELYDAVEQFRRDVGGGYIPDITVGSEVVTEFQNNIYFGTGAALSAGTRAALDTFWEALVTAGIHDKMLTVCPFVPDSLIATLTPMVCNGTYRNLTNAGTGFAAGDLTVNGLMGDALGKYLNTGYWVPSRLWFDYDDIGITLYIHTGRSEGSTDGACANAAYVNAYSVQNPSDNMYCDLGNAGASRIGPVADVAATGYYSGNRTAADDMRLYKAKSAFAHAQIGQNLVATADVRNTITVPMVLFAYNINSTIGGYSSKRVSFWAAHLGLTSGESLAFYNAIQALRTALGGGYV